MFIRFSLIDESLKNLHIGNWPGPQDSFISNWGFRDLLEVWQCSETYRSHLGWFRDNFWPLDIALTSLFRQKWLILSLKIPRKWPFWSISIHFLQFWLAKQSRFVIESTRKVSYGLGFNSRTILPIKYHFDDKNGSFLLQNWPKMTIF